MHIWYFLRKLSNKVTLARRGSEWRLATGVETLIATRHLNDKNFQNKTVEVGDVKNCAECLGFKLEFEL